jgi:hypothetical protein
MPEKSASKMPIIDRRAKSFLTAIIACLAILIARPAAGQVACSEQDPTEHLAGERFGERVVAYATSEAGSVLIRIFGNIATGTWTIVMSRAAPVMHCIIGAGEDFEVVPVEDQPKPKGTSSRSRSASYAQP